MSCWISPLISGGVAVAGTVVGATLGYKSASRLDEAKEKRLRQAAWDAEQAADIRQLQYELVLLKKVLAPGREPKGARRLAPLDSVPSRNRALMLCTRLADSKGDEIYFFLRDDAKEAVEAWRRGRVESWLPFNGELQRFVEELGEVRKQYGPKG